MLERGDNKEVIFFTSRVFVCGVEPLAFRLLTMITCKCSISQLRVWQHLIRQLQSCYSEQTTQQSNSKEYVVDIENIDDLKFERHYILLVMNFFIFYLHYSVATRLPLSKVFLELVLCD